MSGPPEPVARARVAVNAALASRLEECADRSDGAGLLPRGLVGVSGGADSLALAATTQWVASRLGLEVEAVLIDHGLSEHSASVSERAALQCERLGLARCHIRRIHVDTAGEGGLENAARVARHDCSSGTPSTIKLSRCCSGSHAERGRAPSRGFPASGEHSFALSSGREGTRRRGCGGVIPGPCATPSISTCGTIP